MTEPTGWPHMLPCPFCGGDARHDAHADDCYFILHRKFKNSGADMSPAFEVLAAWNRRTQQPVVREPLTDENVEAASRRAFPRWWYAYGFSLCGGDPDMQTPQRVYAMRGFMGGFESGYKVALTELGITQKGGSNAE